MRAAYRATRRGSTVAVLSIVVAGCGGPAGSAESPSPSPDTGVVDGGASLPAGHPTTAAPELGGTRAPAAPESGTVLEVLAGGGYTYAKLYMEDGGREMWVAGPETSLQVGQQVGIAGAMSMGSFVSPSLGRTFDDLYFVGGFQPAGPPPDASEGEVVEVLEGGGYTYVLAQVGDDEMWLAGPLTEVAEGDTVLWRGGMDMGQFSSPSLGRTFVSILFVERLWVRR